MSILVATPCYGGMATEPYIYSCDILKKECNLQGLEIDFLRLRNESLITRARNVCASSFLYDTDYDCLLFIDSDIEFEPADVARLWNLCNGGGDGLDGKKADVAVGAYRNKKADSTRSAWVNGELRLVEEFKKPFDVDYAGTGFMMIRRNTFKQLEHSYPEWEYEEGFPEEGEALEDTKIQTCWAFFQDPIEDTKNGRFHLSEDYFFVKRVIDLGMRVVMDPEIHLKHWGMAAY